MNSKVFFTPVDNTDSIQTIKEKIDKLLNKSSFVESLKPGLRSVVKMHFGEDGNTGYIRPELVSVVCNAIIKSEGAVILSDSNTLYRGRRVQSEEHRKLALEHGFTKDVTGADVVIADEQGGAVASLPMNLQYVKTAKIPRLYLDTDLFISMAHFKGHMMAGFAGSLKNIGMGCASREGKLFQHSDIAPRVYGSRCTACGVCVNSCQVNAISIENKKARVNASLCTGCAACIAVCRFGAMEADWAGGSQLMQEKMVEYASSVLKNVPKSIHINFAIKITAECDCMAGDDPRVIDDIGIFISEDPVACDQACYDAVIKKAGRDIFKELHPSQDGKRHLLYAERIGIGSRTYELVKIEA